MKTLTSISKSQLEIKKSKFITYLIPVHNLDDIQQALKLYSEKEASHNCFAYKIGTLEKAYDDGEPSGTAGKPILNVIQKQNLDHLLILVIRYFGGIKLGAGGLTRAYSHSAANALEKAIIGELVLAKKYECTFDYAYSAKIEHLLTQHHILILHKAYNIKVSFIIVILDNSILQTLSNLTNGSIIIKDMGQDYISVDS